MLFNKTGDLFKAEEKYIVHQCNCVTTRAAHLAYHMFKNFHWSDVYTPRQNKYQVTPGDILIRGNGEDQRFVIAILGQFYPGFVRYPESKKDGFSARESYFQKGLDEILQISDVESIAFPYKIGCGAAGGNWENYYKMIEDFADKANFDVTIYKLPES